MKPIIPVAYSMTQAEITAGAANNIAKGTPIIVTDANGQPIDIKTAQGGGQPPVEAAGIKNNFAATTAPGTSNDSTQGYAVGSRWINTTGDETYVCMDVSSGAAVWEKTTAGTIAEIAGLQTALDGKSATTHNHSGTYEPANSNIQSHVTSAHAPAGAEANVNADWNAVSGDAQILNKPIISALEGTTNPITDGTATVGTATTASRSDHIHPRDFTDWTTYTPVITSESGGWASYTATGRYKIVDRMLTVSFRVIFNGISAAASAMYVGIPSGLTMNANVMTGGASWDTDLIGFGVLGDSGTVSGVPAIITTRTNQKVIVKYYYWNGTYVSCPGMTNTVPWIWTTNDTIDGIFTVPIV